MSLKQPKFKSKNVKPKKKKHSKKILKKQLLMKQNQLKTNKNNNNILTLEEILNLINKKFSCHFYGGIYFGRTYNLQYYYAPIGTETGKEFWQISELTPEMLKLTFNANQWYLESGDLMLDQF